MTTPGDPTHADQLLQPFRRVLRNYPQIPKQMLDLLGERDPEHRLSVRLSQDFLRGCVELTGDPDLGLKAAQATEVGDFEVFEFVAASAPTWRAGIEALMRYSKLLNGAADFRLEIDAPCVRVLLHSTVELERAGIDFQVAAFHVGFARRRLPRPEKLEVCFRHAAPPDVSVYAETFGETEVHFGQPFDGFRFESDSLDRPLQSANATLHDALRAHADELLSKYASGDGWVEQVRADILAHMGNGRPGAAGTADRMGVSRRTLTRKLATEGTNFTDLLATLREHTARHYLASTRHSVEDIAFLLGFSESPPFVRAFKRWTGCSPLEYRRAQT